MSVAFINNHGEKGYNHDVNHDETKMHELHQTYGTLLSEEQNLKIRVTIHQILAVDLDQETFTMELDVCFRWKDPRLRNAKTRVWLPRESTLKGRRTCEGGTCYCRGGLRGQRCSKLPFVLGIFKEEKGKDYIKVEDKNGGYHDWQLLSSFIYKEEPNFSDLGQLFRGDRGGSSIVIFSKLMEEPTVLNDFQRLSNGETGETVLFRKLRADFKENMELEHFPFDRQLLQFTITASVPVSMLKLEVDEKVKSVCRVEDLPEYKVNEDENEAVGILKEKTIAPNVNNKQYSQVKVMVHLQRKPQKYMVNIVFMVYMLVFASCSSFVIPLEKTGDRIASIITFILTIMALKYVINDELPGKDYQTWLDYYLLISYVLLTLPALELLALQVLHVLWRSIDPDESLDVISAKHEGLDLAFAIVFFSFWNGSHLVLWLTYKFCPECFYHSWDKVRATQDHYPDQSVRAEETTRLCSSFCEYFPIDQSELDSSASESTSD